MYIMSWHSMCFVSQITNNITRITTAANNYWSEKISCNCNAKMLMGDNDHFSWKSPLTSNIYIVIYYMTQSILSKLISNLIINIKGNNLVIQIQEKDHISASPTIQLLNQDNPWTQSILWGAPLPASTRRKKKKNIRV